MKNYNICVIGGGIGGYSAAIKAKKLGATVCLIEENKLGGTCLNCGCIPTKTYHYTAELLSKMKDASKIGIDAENFKLNFVNTKARKEKVVTKLTDGVKTLIKANKIDLITGKAKILSKNEIEITKNEGSKENINFDNLIIATGSSPVTFDSFNVDNKNIFVPEKFLDITEVPKSLIIVGGGVIGIEFASIFSHFGCEVTIIELLPQILLNVDSEVRNYIERVFKRNKIKVLTSTKVDSVKVENREVVALTSQGTINAEKALIGIGRKPNLANIGLENVGLKLEKNKPLTNEKMQTEIANIYIIGDAAGKSYLAHTALHEGIVAAQNAFGKNAIMNYDNIPSCIFSIPEIAFIGRAEDELKKLGVEYSVGKFPYAAIGKAACINEIDGFAKILTNKKTGEILGCHIIGVHASDLIGEALLMVGKKMNVKDISHIIHPHPTLTEILFEACEDTIGEAIHKI